MAVKGLMIVDSYSHGTFIRYTLLTRCELPGEALDMIPKVGSSWLISNLPDRPIDGSYDFFLVLEGDHWSDKDRIRIFRRCTSHSPTAPILWVQANRGFSPPATLIFPDGSDLVEWEEPERMLARITELIEAIVNEHNVAEAYEAFCATDSTDLAERLRPLDELIKDDIDPQAQLDREYDPELDEA